MILGHAAWKDDPRSDDYDYELIARRLTEMREARESEQGLKLLFLLRTTISRNLGDMGNVQVLHIFLMCINLHLIPCSAVVLI